MADIQQITDGMLQTAGTVLGRLVELPVTASAARRRDHGGSIKIDAQTLVAVAQIPAAGIKVVVRFESGDIAKVVNVMLGSPDDAAELGAMQLSIVSETVSQIAGAMAEELAKRIGAGVQDVHAELCTDATNLPAPPFASYEGTVAVGNVVAPRICIDFDGIALSKIGTPAAPPNKPAAREAAPARTAPAAAPVAFAAMSPTLSRTLHGGSNLELVHDVPLQISAVLGKTGLTLRDVVALQSGSVFELDKLSSDPIDLYVNNILIARGEVVVVDDKFAVKIAELNPSAE